MTHDDTATSRRRPTLVGVGGRARTEAANPAQVALFAAAAGRFLSPPAPVEVVPAPPHLAGALLSFTGCTFVAADIDLQEVEARLGDNPFVGPALPAFAEWLAGEIGGHAHNHEVVLAASGSGRRPPQLEPDPAWRAHDRANHGARFRRDVRGWRHDHGVVLVGRGVFDRWEVAYEVSPGAPPGAGRALAAAARGVVPAGEPLFAQIAPGHARSLRACLAAGYRPVGGETLITADVPSP